MAREAESLFGDIGAIVDTRQDTSSETESMHLCGRRIGRGGDTSQDRHFLSIWFRVSLIPPRRETMDPGIINQVKQLYEVEKLSQRQIVTQLGISRKRVLRILRGERVNTPIRETIFKPYERLVQECYREYPFLRVTQVYERLKGCGYTGGYDTVKVHTQSLRKKKSGWFHELEFLPGEEAQVDWMEWRFPFAPLYGFVLILAYSRYLYVHFYPRHSMEFFLNGHLRAFREMGGVAHRHRYDNLKSVVLSRIPELTFNPQFLDFVRHYGFSVHPCTPGRANGEGTSGAGDPRYQGLPPNHSLSGSDRGQPQGLGVASGERSAGPSVHGEKTHRSAQGRETDTPSSDFLFTPSTNPYSSQ